LCRPLKAYRWHSTRPFATTIYTRRKYRNGLRQKNPSAYDQAMRYLAVITMLVLVMAQPVAAQSFKPDYDAGYAAYTKNDYATALRHLKPLAKQGDAKAQRWLGAMYLHGYGVTKDYKEAARWYRKAAEQGHVLAQYWLTELRKQLRAQARLRGHEKRLRRKGNRPPRSRQAKAKPAFTPDNKAGMAAYDRGDYATTLKHLRPLAIQGNSRAQFYLGTMYRRGYGVTKDYKETVRWYRKAAEQGYAPAQYNLGVMYHFGHGVPKDNKENVRWWRKAAEQGHTYAQQSLASLEKRLRREGNWPPRSRSDIPWAPGDYETWRPLAEQGDAKAQNRLGEMYHVGHGVTKDKAEAVRWWRKAAEQGDADAQAWLGVMYYEGWGVTQDYKEAVRWWRKAAKQGDALAHTNLARLEKQLRREGNWPPRSRQASKPPAPSAQSFKPDYSAGYAAYVKRDYATALRHFRPLAEQGHARAQNWLGVMYELGQGVTKDLKEAFRRYRNAARQGNASAQLSLGAMYEHGYGVTKDLKEAVRWYRTAAKQGNTVAQGNLASLEKQLRAAGNRPPRSRQARKSPEPSSQVQKENERLRRENARLKKEMQAKPKKVAKKPKPSPKKGSAGSGFFISKAGHVITNQHVVSKCKRVTVGDNTRKQVTADILETDRSNDLALLKISSTKMASAETKSLMQKLGIKIVPLASKGLIPMLTDYHSCAQSRRPMDMIFHGWSMSWFQAKQQ
jgi:TPR repeat protein